MKASGSRVYDITVYEGTVFSVDGCWCIVRQQLKAMSVDSCWVPASSQSGTVRAQAVAMANGVAYIVGEDNKVYSQSLDIMMSTVAGRRLQMARFAGLMLRVATSMECAL